MSTITQLRIRALLIRIIVVLALTVGMYGYGALAPSAGATHSVDGFDCEPGQQFTDDTHTACEAQSSERPSGGVKDEVFVDDPVIAGICGQPNTDTPDAPGVPIPDGPSANTTDECDCTADTLTPDNCGIVQYSQVGVTLLSGIAGMAIVGGIMAAGYQYMTARDNPGAIAAARQRVVWALVALLILLLLWGFLQWAIPGGILSGEAPSIDA